MQIEQMPMVRIFFEKTGRAKYTSHLDTMRTMTRAIRRSGLPFWYTQGFNPHLYMTFPLALPLGTESLCECVDLRMTEKISFDEVQMRVNNVMPEGFSVTKAAAPLLDPSGIAYSDYTVVLHYADGVVDQLEQLDTFMAQTEILVMKRGKKGEREIDIRPHVQLLEALAEKDGITLKLRTAAGIQLNIAPTLLLQAFYIFTGRIPDGCDILRTAVLTKDLKNFE